MNRIRTLFTNKSVNILSVYFTAGFPSLDDTTGIIQFLEKHKADMIEIGIPFSDPVADGPVIQESSSKALANGMTLKLLFNQLQHIRESVKIPLIMMGYINPILHMGMEKFLEQCELAGIDGVIIPDLPVEEYLEHYKELFSNYGVINIFLITPQTPEERIRFIDDISEGFIYMVASSSTTGIKKEFDNKQIDYFGRVKDMKLTNPCLAGFGISDRETFNTACQFVNGAIIGSAFIKTLGGTGNMEEKISKFIGSITNIPANADAEK